MRWRVVRPRTLGPEELEGLLGMEVEAGRKKWVWFIPTKTKNVRATQNQTPITWRLVSDFWYERGRSQRTLNYSDSHVEGYRSKSLRRFVSKRTMSDYGLSKVFRSVMSLCRQNTFVRE